MTIQIKVPELPESVNDALVVLWNKKLGEFINADEILLELETDKIVLEIPAIKSGIIKNIFFKAGATVVAGDILGELDETTDNTLTAQTKITSSPSPSIRKMMAAHDIKEDQITGSGKQGRIIKKDVEDYLKQAQQKILAAPVTKNNASEALIDTKPDTNAITPQSAHSQPVDTNKRYLDERLINRVPMTRLRAKIAERLVYSQQQSASLTTFNEVNMAPIMGLRTRYKQAFEEKYGVRLGFMSFFIQASIKALAQFPEINASIDGTDIIYHGFYDIGIAVSAPNGLVVPILRDAQTQNIAELEQSIVYYSERAKNNKLTLDDITGGTFTISNGGVFGSMLSTPILNPPQSAILGLHNIMQRVMVVDGEMKILPMMYLALSYDHRLIDGKSAVQFLVTIKEQLEDPSRMLLNV